LSEQVIIVGIVAVVIVVAILVFRHKGEVDVDLPGVKGRGAFERAPTRGRTKMKDVGAGRNVRVDDTADGDIDMTRVHAGDRIDVSRSSGGRSEHPTIDP
jgi:hypothetical protein